MAEWADNIATMEYNCPHCGAIKGETCRTPAGHKSPSPHGKRVHQLSKTDWDRCKGRAYSAAEALGAIGFPKKILTS